MKPVAVIAIVVFGLVSLAHLFRMGLGWSVTVNDADVPMWVSAVGFIVPAVLAVMLYRESRKRSER